MAGSAEMPWDDVEGTIVAIGISVLLAFVFHRQGRHSYPIGLYWSCGNIVISLAGLASNGGFVIGGWWAVPYFLSISAVFYLATLGALVAFRDPKNVKCFRCEYVDWPSETEERRTPFDDAELSQFRKLHRDGERRRRELHVEENYPPQASR